MKLLSPTWIVFPAIFATMVPSLYGQVRAGASFRGLGDLPGGATSSRAYAVSRDGRYFVGQGTIASGTEAVRWSNTGVVTEIGDLAGGSFSSQANGVSSNGLVIVGEGQSVHGREAFLWTPSVGIVGLGSLLAGDFSSFATGVSSDGAVLVGGSHSVGGGDEAFLWTAASGMVGLGDLDPSSPVSSIANAVSADGSVVVGQAQTVGGTSAFRWTAQTGMSGLGLLPGASISGQAYGVSSNGSTIVGYQRFPGGSYHAFRWTAATGTTDLGDVTGGSFRRLANAVSDDGNTIVGDVVVGDGTFFPFIWSPALGVRNFQSYLESFGLNIGGWQLLGATDISADGRTIVGTGTNPSGNIEAWVATLPKPLVATDAVAAPIERWECQGIGGLGGGSPRDLSTAWKMSRDGRFVTGWSDSTLGTEAFLWQSTGMIGLGDLPSGEYFSFGWCVGLLNGTPIVMGQGTNDSDYPVPVQWTSSSGLVQMSAIPGSNRSEVLALSADGRTAVGTAERSRFVPCIWVDGVPAELPLPPNYDTGFAWAVSANGRAIAGGVYSTADSSSQAVLWTDQTTIQTLGTFGAEGISSDGRVVVGGTTTTSVPVQHEAIRWTDTEGVQYLGHLPGATDGGRANAVSASGYIIVGYALSASYDGYEAFRWTPQNGMVPLRQFLSQHGATMGGWTLTDATDISDDGSVIVGNGTNPAGQNEGWIARRVDH